MREPLNPNRISRESKNYKKRQRKLKAKFYAFAQDENCVIPLRYVSQQEICKAFNGWNSKTDIREWKHLVYFYGIAGHGIIQKAGWYRLTNPDERSIYNQGRFKYGYPQFDGYGRISNILECWEARRDKKQKDAHCKIRSKWYDWEECRINKIIAENIKKADEWEKRKGERFVNSRPIGRKFWSIMAAASVQVKS